MGEENKAAPRAGNAGAADNDGQTHCTTSPKPAQDLAPIYCERCCAFEYITLAEQAHRLDESGNILCTSCFTRPIDTAGGGPLHWAICDALFGFLRELEQRGVVEPYDDTAWHCLRRVYHRMGGADYLTPTDRAVVFGVGR